MASTSFGNVGLQFLNNEFYYFSNEFFSEIINSKFNFDRERRK